MHLKQLLQFVAIAECGSLHLAARRLGISQPAMTKAMRQLEERLGAPLLIRGVRGTTLTHFGRAFLPRARAVVAEIQQAAEEFADMRGDARNSLSIAVSPIAAIAIVPDALKIFRVRNPDTKIRIVDGMQPSGASLLRAGSVDLYVGTLETGESGPDLKSEDLFANEVVVTCRLGHPRAGAKALRDLAGAEWAGGVVSQRRETVRKIFADHGYAPPRSVTQCESFISLIAMVAASDLLTVLPLRMHEHKLFSSIIRPIAIAERLQIPPVGILRKADSPATSIQLAFIRAVRQAGRGAARR